MSSPLYARIPTTRFGCGCTVHTELDVNGITPWLEHCPLHAKAGEMREEIRSEIACLSSLRQYLDLDAKNPVVEIINERLTKARAMLRVIEGRETP